MINVTMPFALFSNVIILFHTIFYFAARQISNFSVFFTSHLDQKCANQ